MVIDNLQNLMATVVPFLDSIWELFDPMDINIYIYGQYIGLKFKLTLVYSNLDYLVLNSVL